jgi:hypothetical protein
VGTPSGADERQIGNFVCADVSTPSLAQALEARQQDYTIEWYSEHSTTQAEHDEIKNIRQEIPSELQSAYAGHHH